MFTLKFSTATPAFDAGRDDPDVEDGALSTHELARILRCAAIRIERVGIDYNDPRAIRDIDGQTVGAFEVTRS